MALNKVLGASELPHGEGIRYTFPKYTVLQKLKRFFEEIIVNMCQIIFRYFFELLSITCFAYYSAYSDAVVS
jgi:hypothetical protein